MRNTLLFSVLLLIFSGCGALNLLPNSDGNKYQYRYVLTSPVSSDKLVFRDSTIFAQFRFDDGAVRFQVQNITGGNISIDWGRMTIGVRKRFSSIRNSATIYSAATPSQAATVLPPLGYVIDFAIPEKNITPQDGWHENDLLPTVDKKSPELRDKILGAVGTPITLVMPVRIGSVIRDYTFQFQVAGVNQIPWAQVKPPRRPTPPIRAHDMYASEQFITAGIVATVVGVASILISKNKSQPSE